MLTRCSRRLLGALFAALACAVAFPGTPLYQYDALGRLEVVKDETGKSTTYVLDAAGNRVSQTTVTITVPPPEAGRLQFSASSYTVGENSGTLSVTVTRTNGSTGAVAVRYATTDGTATAGVDYVGASGLLAWSNGETSPKAFTIQINNDSTFEGNESIGVVLSSPIGVQLGSQTSASITLAEDDLPDTTPPSVPTGLSASAPSSSLVNLSWNASTDTGGSGLAGYKVYRNGSQIGTAGGTSYADSTVSGTVQYTYQVAAYDNRGNTSALSAGFPISTPDTIPPSVPTGLTATAIAYNQVNLSWNASPDTGGSGTRYYNVYRNGAHHSSTNLGEITYLDFFGVAPSTTYTYRVSAVDFAGNESAQSASASTTTPSPPLNPPGTPSWTGGYENCTSVCITGGSGEVLTWAAGVGGMPGYYEMQVKVGPADWTGEATTSALSLPVGIPINTTRFYRVRACNTAGCSGYSTVIGFFYDPNP